MSHIHLKNGYHVRQDTYNKETKTESDVYNKDNIHLLKRISYKSGCQVQQFDKTNGYTEISRLIVRKYYNDDNKVQNALVAKFNVKNLKNTMMRYFTRNEKGKLEIVKEFTFMEFLDALANVFLKNEPSPSYEIINCLSGIFTGMLKAVEFKPGAQELFSKLGGIKK